MIVYQFFVLPAIGGFVLLCAVLAFVLIPAGILMAIPAYAPIGLALALGFCVEMSLQTSYTADLAAIVNSNSAFVLGGVAALVVTRLMRVIGTQASARRLMRATYRDLADLADGRARPTRDQWASRMLDRVALLLYRQPRFEPRPQHEFADALEDLRLGVNIIETQSIAPRHVEAGARRFGGDVRRPGRAFPRFGARPGARRLATICCKRSTLRSAKWRPAPRPRMLASPRLSACGGRSTLMRRRYRPMQITGMPQSGPNEAASIT